ncbi:unnamed protein product [Triticum turgidum subsp. durum]|uniref:RING-type E3 ubiquitin transferase n=1 Tax=Triticum turgidum subsp. durum TaxID=4567 RepID=A0A9R1RVS0_TRITD|nr:unnamed protein product [Triticum turgidum subsp. durum]
MEDTSNSNKRKGDGEQLQGRTSGCKRQNVSTVMEIFDCTVCSKPLRPPIFQCSKGNSICGDCQERLPLLEGIGVQRSYIMERVVDNIFVSCKHGCSTTIAYYQKEKHERQCPCGPCLCPVSGCGFVASTTVLLDHLATVHTLPTTPMELFQPFQVPVQPGSRVLKTKYNRLFLLKMEALESYGHGVSLVCVQPETPGGNVRITVGFSCAPGHNQESKWEMGPDGVPTECLCIVPRKETDIVATITIEREDYDED